MIASSAFVAIVVAQVAATTPTAETVAQALFDEGLSLMEAGRLEEACPKLAESQRLDPGGGTLLNLASCLERSGKPASAVATYNEALSSAIRDGRKEREALAREHIAALQAKVSHVRLTVSSPVPNLTILLDDVPVGPAGWGAAWPVDPGEHVIAARSPGRRSVELRVSVGAAPSDQALVLPMLQPEPEPASASRPPASSPKASRRAPALALGAGGLAVVGFGIVAGALAFGAKSDSDAACPTQRTCTDRGVAAMDRAEAWAWTSTVAVGTGVVAIGIATYLLLAAPPRTGAATAARNLVWAF